MMTEKRYNISLTEFKEGIINEISDNLVSMILYGSYAHGKKNIGDIDILLVVKKPLGSPHQTNKRIARISGRIFGKYKIPLSCLTYSLDQFNELKGYLPLFDEIKKEGVTIYGKNLFTKKAV